MQNTAVVLQHQFQQKIEPAHQNLIHKFINMKLEKCLISFKWSTPIQFKRENVDQKSIQNQFREHRYYGATTEIGKECKLQLSKVGTCSHTIEINSNV